MSDTPLPMTSKQEQAAKKLGLLLAGATFNGQKSSEAMFLNGLKLRVDTAYTQHSEDPKERRNESVVLTIDHPNAMERPEDTAEHVIQQISGMPGLKDAVLFTNDKGHEQLLRDEGVPKLGKYHVEKRDGEALKVTLNLPPHYSAAQVLEDFSAIQVGQPAQSATPATAPQPPRAVPAPAGGNDIELHARNIVRLAKELSAAVSEGEQAMHPTTSPALFTEQPSISVSEPHLSHSNSAARAP